MSDIACQATLAFVSETKLLVYNDFCLGSVLMGKRMKHGPKCANFKNWLKTHPKVGNVQNNHLFHHFDEMLA